MPAAADQHRLPSCPSPLPQWAHLDPVELQRRQNLARRREQLAARALELDVALRAQERKAIYERQRLAELRDESRALAMQQVGSTAGGCCWGDE